MRDMAFGQFYPANSFVHKMDARIKILLSIAYLVAVFLIKEFVFWGFLAAAVFIVVACIFSKVPVFKVIGSVKAILVFVILSAVLQIFFNKEGNIVVNWWIFKITDIGFKKAAFIVLRIMLVVMGTSLLTLTTTPLRLIKFPVHEFALIMSIALRYIPTLLDETDRIIKAQKARGADFESGGLFKRAKAMIPVLIPLLISSFRRADELADAMEARCYSGAKGRTKYKKAKLGWRDLLGTLFTAGLTVTVCILNGWIKI